MDDVLCVPSYLSLLFCPCSFGMASKISAIVTRANLLQLQCPKEVKHATTQLDKTFGRCHGFGVLGCLISSTQRGGTSEMSEGGRTALTFETHCALRRDC